MDLDNLHKLLAAADEDLERAGREAEAAQLRIKLARVKRDTLREALDALNGERIATAPAGETAAAPRRGVRRKRTSPYLTRRAAVREILRRHAPQGPSEIARLAAAHLGEPVTVTQVTDLLRREQDIFRRIGQGSWTLASEANGTGEGGSDA